MPSIADGSVRIQTSSEFVPSTPSWLGEVVLMTAHLRKHGVLTKIAECVHAVRRRFGHYEVIDFLAVLFGYAISGECTLEAFYERVHPFAGPFMALYELFFTNLPPRAFTASDVVERYLHRGAFEPQLSDEDSEQDPDRWCSHSAWGQVGWQVVSPWVWNLRLELGHQLHPAPVRTTELAPALPPPSPRTAPSSGYAPPQVGLPWKTGRFSGQDFALQPDGTLRCPADQRLIPHEQRREADGSLRVVYGASIPQFGLTKIGDFARMQAAGKPALRVGAHGACQASRQSRPRGRRP